LPLEKEQSMGPYLSRREAARHLREKWGAPVAVTEGTLETLAVRGGGPAFHKINGRRVGYTINDLDAWAAARVSGAVRSTSDTGATNHV
jgi:hypothetical protein